VLKEPVPPKEVFSGADGEVRLLVDEVRRLREDVAFLRKLLRHVQEEFSRLKEDQG